MGDTNLERLKTVYAELAKGNLRAGAELYAPDVSYQPMAIVGRGSVGLAEAEEVMREFVAEWEDFRIEGLAFEDLGDTILVLEHQSGRGRASGIEIEHTDYAAWTFRDGLVIRVRWRMDRESALEGAAAGSPGES
jgi:ketosteroid isomerase-like protein